MYKCSKCGSRLIWQNDFDYEDYLIEDSEGIVAVYYCCECDLLHEYFINFDNVVENISISTLED